MLKVVSAMKKSQVEQGAESKDVRLRGELGILNPLISKASLRIGENWRQNLNREKK